MRLAKLGEFLENTRRFIEKSRGNGGDLLQIFRKSGHENYVH